MHTPPILLPDVTSFGELLDYHGEWSHYWPRDPETNAIIAPVQPRHIGRGEPHWQGGISRGNEIGPFCSCDLSQLDGPRHRGMAVRATDLVIEAVAPRIVTPDDHLSFQIIGHAHTGRALVILSHGYITGSHWLAEIDPATIPPYPFAARDRRSRAIHDAMQEAGQRPVQYRNQEPHAIEYRDGHNAPPTYPRAVIHPDGRVTRHWRDGTISHEPV